MSEIAEACRAVIGGARRLAAVATHIVEQSDDAIFRNGVMVFLTQLNKGNDTLTAFNIDIRDYSLLDIGVWLKSK